MDNVINSPEVGTTPTSQLVSEQRLLLVYSLEGVLPR